MFLNMYSYSSIEVKEVITETMYLNEVLIDFSSYI